MDRQTDRTDGQMERRTDRRTDREKDGHTDRRTDRPTDRQTNGQRKQETDVRTPSMAFRVASLPSFFLTDFRIFSRGVPGQRALANGESNILISLYKKISTEIMTQGASQGRDSFSRGILRKGILSEGILAALVRRCLGAASCISLLAPKRQSGLQI